MSSGFDEPLRVLLVEDNPGDTKWFQLTLDDLQFAYVLQVAENGEDALQILRNSHSDGKSMPHIVFLDLNLPGLTGGEVLEIWRTESDQAAQLPICVLTSSPLERRLLLERFQIQPQCYLLKPVTPETFLTALECFEPFRPLAKDIRARLTPGNWHG